MDTTTAIVFFVALLISLTVHEAAHAFVAWKGGDPTAYLGGQVSLNPIPHIRREPFGMVLLPVLMLFVFQTGMILGYASTPIDQGWAWRHPRKAALMSAAGPLSNLLLAALAFAVLWFLGRPDGETGEAIARIAQAFLLLNLLLCLFNLFPLPPLDGAGVVEGLFPRTRGLFDHLRRNPSFGLIGLLLVIYLMPQVFRPVYSTVLGWLR